MLAGSKSSIGSGTEPNTTVSSGARYLQRLNDGRKVWLDGKLVQHIANHPAFRGTIKSVAGILDLQDEPELAPHLVFETETGAHANMAFLIPEQKEDVFRRSRAFKIWSDATFGVMSRVGGTYRGQVAGLYIGRELLQSEDPDYSDKIVNYYRYVRDHDLLVTSAGHDPQIDRTKLSSELGGLYTALRIVRETEDGIIVRGAKMLATGSPYMDEIIVSPLVKKTAEEKQYALLLMVAVNTPGLHLICRESFASEEEENHPLSSRFDEMDAVLVFDDALIPWERVLVKEDPELLWKVRSTAVGGGLGLHKSIVRLVSKLEFVAAVGNELADSIGIKKFAHVKEKLAELFYQLESIKALLLTAEHGAKLDPSGVWLPDSGLMATAKNLGNRYYPRAIEILQQLSGAGLLQAPSTLAEFRGPLGTQLQAYYRGADRGAEERVKLLKLAWELVGSQLGARHELYERYYAGDPIRTYARQYVDYNKQPHFDKVQEYLLGSTYHQ
ncbi:4-hydroxyphenylacetate 3-monooxygenase [Paenibacillus sp. 1_12]|uniref:4-hydroxyphenylacetate 3-hydroxylase family protein n=1 Tax=Paenibacillus sp. 1_12 TaxID=1566278 RepID=UPI0008ECDD54|nr:4-hydroxyphenylacetate 3-hydroxylase N-terminal domain-containing protein [Paenibacillus sp. 1_12]SFM17089.1 4-hydroxyphenylacetate 3-monooxygenase [Paenibacillus sp. 1_12]